jgi:hypothetical protein
MIFVPAAAACMFDSKPVRPDQDTDTDMDVGEDTDPGLDPDIDVDGDAEVLPDSAEDEVPADGMDVEEEEVYPFPADDCTVLVGPEEDMTSIQAALDLAEPGDVICVKPGLYHEALRVHRSGSESLPIVVKRYDHERPVVDGQYDLPYGTDYPAGCPGTLDGNPYECFRYDPLVGISASHVALSGFEIRNSAGRCAQIYGSDGVTNVTVRDNIIHDCRGDGIPTLQGSTNVMVEFNEIYHTNNFAPFSRGARDLDWGAPACVKASTEVVYRGNIFHENWGEGFISDCNTGNAGFVVLENNVWYDNYAITGPYIHATHDVVVRNNLIYYSPDPEYYRSGGPMPCITMTPAEPQYDDDINTIRITVENNILAGCMSGLAFWGSDSGRTISDVEVRNNTFVDFYSGIGINGASTAFMSDVRFLSNLFVGAASYDVTGFASEGNLDFASPAEAGLLGSDGTGTLPDLDRGTVLPGWFEVSGYDGIGADVGLFTPAGPLWED